MCTVRPGFADEPPKEAGRGLLWSRQRTSQSKFRKGVLSGLLVETPGASGVKVTAAEITKCRRCHKLRPEVSFLSHTIPPILNVA